MKAKNNNKVLYIRSSRLKIISRQPHKNNETINVRKVFFLYLRSHLESEAAATLWSRCSPSSVAPGLKPILRYGSLCVHIATRYLSKTIMFNERIESKWSVGRSCDTVSNYKAQELLMCPGKQKHSQPSLHNVLFTLERAWNRWYVYYCSLELFIWPHYAIPIQCSLKCFIHYACAYT